MKNHFKNSEFSCNCCSKTVINQELFDKLNQAREIAGIPFVLNSAYRCEKHNKAVGGSSTSSHIKGLAVDIKADTGHKTFVILDALLKVGFTRIGIAETFIHVDVDKEKTQNTIWTY